MKLYVDPTSTTSLPILLFLAEHDIAVETMPVLLAKADQTKPEYAALNPNKCVPALQDGDFILTECSAILKYLAEKCRSEAYPADLKARAHVNEVMDWFNTGFYRDLGYGLVYQRALPKFHFNNPATQTDVLRRNEERSIKWLQVLNDHWLRGGKFVCGLDLTLADYLGSCYLAIVEWIGYEISDYANIVHWMRTMKARPSWEKTHAPWNALTAMRAQQVKLASTAS
jgi:glutathione S-transferase